MHSLMLVKFWWIRLGWNLKHFSQNTLSFDNQTQEGINSEPFHLQTLPVYKECLLSVSVGFR